MEKHIKRGLLLGFLLLAVLYYMLSPVESGIFPRCVFYSSTGLYCPGCGSQRAIHSLLHFNLEGVMRNNILLIPAILAIGYHFIHPHSNTKFNLNLPNIFYLKSTPWIILSIILVFWILRNLTFLPFSELAPS